MDPDEAERLCDALAELASTGPSKDAAALLEARALLRKVTQSAQATTYLKERATEVDRALSGWFDSEDRFRPLLKSHSREIYALIDRLHGALREGSRFKAR
jgi:hypothetical protein